MQKWPSEVDTGDDQLNLAASLSIIRQKVRDPHAFFEEIKGFVSAHIDKLVGGAERVLSSIISMVGLIVLSRSMDIDAFGILATAVGIWLIMEMVQNSLTIYPFILACPHTERDREGFGAWILWNVLVAIVCSLIFVVVGLLLLSVVPDFAYGLIISGPLCLAGMLYMFTRRLQYHEVNLGALITQTVLYGLSYLAGLAYLWHRVEIITPTEGGIVMIIAFTVPAIIMSVPMLRRANFSLGFLNHIKKSRRLISELGAAGIMWQLSYTVTLLALSILATPAAVAIFTVTRTLVRPITLIMATINDVEMSKASRAFASEGTIGVAGVVHNVRVAMSLFCALPIAILLLFPGFFLSLVYGEQYADATLELRLRVLLFIPLIYLSSLDLGLSIIRDTRYLVYINILSLVAGTGYLACAYYLDALDASSALASLVFARVVPLPLLHWRYTRMILLGNSNARVSE